MCDDYEKRKGFTKYGWTNIKLEEAED